MQCVLIFIRRSRARRGLQEPRAFIAFIMVEAEAASVNLVASKDGGLSRAKKRM
jgi:hypothetical protein